MSEQKQMTLFDWLPEMKPLQLGYIDNGEQLKGKMIPFKELKNYIGKEVLLEMPRQSAVDYQIILITNYYEDNLDIYAWENGKAVITGTCDRVGFSDDSRRRKCNAWTSEIYCKNGLGADRKYPHCMYEIKGASNGKT